MRTLAAALAVLALAGCADEPEVPAAPRPAAADPCPVTAPGGRLPAGEPGFNYGDGSLAVVLWPRGTLVAGSLSDGSSHADIQPDGEIEAKLGWWRTAEGELRIEGRRLDAAAPPLRAHVPAGYGPSGFQVSGVTFPTEGCWKVTGELGRSRLAFVVRVRKR